MPKWLFDNKNLGCSFSGPLDEWPVPFLKLAGIILGCGVSELKDNICTILPSSGTSLVKHARFLTSKIQQS